MQNLTNRCHGRLLGVLAIAVALVGCGASGGSQGSTTSDAPPPIVSGTSQPPSEVITQVAPAGDPAPQISGTPATTAKVGQSYSFQPSATDAQHAGLLFAISGAPKWATFSATTGRLSGTPSSADVGVDQNITVQVSNSNATTELPAFSITVVAAGSSTGTATLSWVAPTQNTDGSVLTNLSGYVIHYGSVSKNYTSSVTVANPGLTTYVVEDLPAGRYFFSMTSTASNGTQSNLSAEATVTIS
jgi:hypothetical protein